MDKIRRCRAVELLQISDGKGVLAVRARGLAGRRLLCTEEIVGSNPTGSTSAALAAAERLLTSTTECQCGRSSAVERLLAKEKVVSSILIARS